MSDAVRIVTDTNAMLPAEISDRFAILVASLTIVVDGVEILERDIDLADFYAQLRAGKPVTTAGASPGELLARYEQAMAEGADQILSIHLGSNRSATVDAARLAAREVDVPVRVVDTGSASFIVGCCVWRAAERLAAGAGIEAAAHAAMVVAGSSGSVFTIGEVERAVDGGRLSVRECTGVPVFASVGPEMFEIQRVTTDRAGVEAMVARVASQPASLRVGIGHAGAPAAADELEPALQSLPNVAETIRYIVGASVAAHTGAGSFGAVFHQL